MNILLVAEESAGVTLLRSLVSAAHHAISVMTSTPDSSAKKSSVWKAAEALGLVPTPAAHVKDPAYASEIRSKKLDILINVHSLFVINQAVLKAPPLGCYNLHPGPLPRYAGLNAPSWAIYRREVKYGVTVHRMEGRIDTGPIAYQSFFDVDEEDSGLSLTTKCVNLGLPLVLRLVETAASDPEAIPRIQQDLTKREYFGREVPCGGKLCWSQPASEALAFVRASDYFPFRSPWGYPRSYRGDVEIGIVKAVRTGRPCNVLPGTVGEPEHGGLPVACADEWILVNKITVGRRYFDPAAILKPGDRLCDV